MWIYIYIYLITLPIYIYIPIYVKVIREVYDFKLLLRGTLFGRNIIFRLNFDAPHSSVIV